MTYYKPAEYQLGVDVGEEEHETEIVLENVPSTVYEGDTVEFAGKLRDKVTGYGIANATIKFLVNGTEVKSTTTDSDGAFKFTYCFSRPGTYTLVFRFEGMRVAPSPAVV